LKYSCKGKKEEVTNMFEGLFQPMHLLVVLGIALLVFGPKRLPELGRGLGDGIRGFRSAMKENADSTDAEFPKL
jgi:sec-independent protein translocase protein TatA